MDTEPERPRRRWPPVLWAIIALPLWASLSLLPAVFAGLLMGTTSPPVWWLLPGMALATPVLLRVDRRVGPVSPPATWRPPAAWWTLAAFVAGCGAVILASEVGNILQSLQSYTPIGPGADAPRLTAWQAAGLAVVNGVCLVAVLQGVVQRALASRWPRRWALAGTVALGAFFGGGGFPIQFALLLILPAWIFAHCQRLLPAVAALLPHAIPTVLEALGLGLGIDGFDRVARDAVLWQPVWFDVLGAVLVAAGVAPLLRAFETEP